MYGNKALLIDPGNSLTREVMDKIEEFHKMYRRARGGHKRAHDW